MALIRVAEVNAFAWKSQGEMSRNRALQGSDALPSSRPTGRANAHPMTGSGRDPEPLESMDEKGI
jgi:hypothetical protein